MEGYSLLKEVPVFVHYFGKVFNEPNLGVVFGINSGRKFNQILEEEFGEIKKSIGSFRNSSSIIKILCFHCLHSEELRL